MFIRKQNAKGFTLIELLVVIAIIGILATIVLASLNSARERSRDAKRLGDIRNLQVALELYFDDNGEYPETIAAMAAVGQGQIPGEPLDPLDDIGYKYNAYVDNTSVLAANDCAAAEVCTYYHLGASLENAAHDSLDSDNDINGDTVDGDDNDGCALPTPETTRFCYAVTP